MRSMAKRGPKTKAGKEIVRLNAVRHGVLSTTPVIPDLEKKEDWEAHRAGIIESLDPRGHLEAILAERIAQVTWRLSRLTRYETDSIALAQERVEEDLAHGAEMVARLRGEEPGISEPDAEEDLEFEMDCLRLLERLPDLPDEAPLSADTASATLSMVGAQVGVPDLEIFSFDGAPDGVAEEDFDGWTARLVRQGLEAIAAYAEREPKDLATEVVWNVGKAVVIKTVTARRRAKDLGYMRRERLLPDSATLDKVMRYEAHLNRQLNQTLHELEALQARRQGGVAPLARLDVQGLPEN